MNLWINFYIADYTRFKEELESVYEKFEVIEYSAEPGRVGGCPEDADVSVIGKEKAIIEFDKWLRENAVRMKISLNDIWIDKVVSEYLNERINNWNQD